MKCATFIQDPLRIRSQNFSPPLTFLLEPQAGQSFSETAQHLLDGWRHVHSNARQRDVNHIGRGNTFLSLPQLVSLSPGVRECPSTLPSEFQDRIPVRESGEKTLTAL